MTTTTKTLANLLLLALSLQSRMALFTHLGFIA